MSKGLLIALSSVLILGLGATAFVLMSLLPTQREVKQVVESPPTIVHTQTQPQSLKDLLSMTNNQECTFTDIRSNTAGTVYVSDGRVRGMFSNDVDTVAGMSHMYLDGNVMYLWSDNSTEGVQVSVDVLNQPGIANLPQTVDLDEEINYSCTPWMVDESFFSVPTNVVFTDFSSFTIPTITIPAFPTTPPGEVNQLQCNTCDQLPTESRVKCRQALQCD